ncbi:MAG: type IV pilus modification protein PilV [Burkholderiaceae bacterium]
MNTTHHLRVSRARLSRPLRREAGFTLIEVMVALIVLVLGVLGAAAMTLTAVRDSKQSAIRSQATAFAYELGEMMRMNPTEVTAFVSGTGTASASCYASSCTLAVLASNDYYEWRAKVFSPATGLPGAVVKVCRDHTKLNSMMNCDNDVLSPVVVKFQWTEKNNNGSTGALLATANADQPSLVVTLLNY